MLLFVVALNRVDKNKVQLNSHVFVLVYYVAMLCTHCLAKSIILLLFFTYFSLNDEEVKFPTLFTYFCRGFIK